MFHEVEILLVEDNPGDAELMKKNPAELSSPVQPDGKNSYKAAGENIGIEYREGYNRFNQAHHRADDEDYNAGVLLSTLNIVRERDLQSTVRDTTDRKLPEKMTLYERRLLRTLIDNLPDMIYVKKAEAELKEAKIRAEESDRLKKVFLQNLSHEIRTPMNAVIGFSELLETNKLDNEKMRYCTHIIKEKSYELLGIINEIIDISLIESRQMPVSRDETDINTLLEKSYLFFQDFKRQIEKSHIELSCIKIPDIYNYKIITDSNIVSQILSCLLNNAFKFTDSGSIKFGFHSRHENQLQFFVSDTGMGIQVEKQNIVFDRFRQVDEGVTRRKGGLGLGLSITKGLVELLEGKIWLVSEPENGSTFYFTLPIRLPDARRSERFESHTGHKKYRPDSKIKALRAYTISKDKKECLTAGCRDNFHS